MNEVGTQLFLNVTVDAKDGTPMSELDFALDFYIERDRAVHVEKSALIRVDGSYFALVDSKVLGRGHLMCRATISNEFAGMAGRVIVKAYTGISFGERNRPSYTEYDNGYRLLFGDVGIMAPKKAYIFYGKVVNEITDYTMITEEMLLSPENRITSVDMGVLRKTGIEVEPGDRVVVLVPADSDYMATKDDGIGGKVSFDTSIMGANGEVVVDVDGKRYKLFGEFMTVAGVLYIYVD